MAYDDEIHPYNVTHNHRNTIFRLPRRRKILTTRRRKVQTIHLGGKKRRGGLFLVKVFRKIRLRWLKLQYSCMLKKLKDWYYSVVKDLIEAGATLEAVQQRLIMETYFTVPIMGVPATTIPSSFGPNRPRPINYF
ncbi:PREDICTED: uncharacterized protein LOC104600541 [Nelumbo nucifera]|uniref:Amidase domain-containing protein n=2 Tax=Nelumbo nucifera TaxID=4432 RepID=A0A822ZMQ3_NELNU|nr:PREDICTED: uncharacterized protein LOC104600541 [Nelumbo nucifera]DAD44236.1 TPA_asm: hypothetical protein HUJ06_002466 [Nelumbo nucifera]